MSDRFSRLRRKALDPAVPFVYRRSKARSCAVLVGQKWRVSSSVVLARLQALWGVDLLQATTDEELATAISGLEFIREMGLAMSDSAIRPHHRTTE